MRIGIRVKRRNHNRLLVAKHSEIYDMDSGYLLPALGASITMDINRAISVVTELELSDMEIVDED